MTTKLNLLATLGALILFFLPWIDIQCSQRSMITQTGIQTIHGGGTLAEEFKSKQDDAPKKGDDRPGPAILVGIALVFTLAAFGFSLASAFGRRNRDRAVGILCGAALALIIVQLILKFPAERDIANSRKDKPAAEDLSAIGSALVDIRVEYRTPLYLELAALALPVLLILNTAIDKRRNQQIN
jgi:hypothetical protein